MTIKFLGIDAGKTFTLLPPKNKPIIRYTHKNPTSNNIVCPHPKGETCPICNKIKILQNYAFRSKYPIKYPINHGKELTSKDIKKIIEYFVQVSKDLGVDFGFDMDRI